MHGQNFNTLQLDLLVVFAQPSLCLLILVTDQTHMVLTHYYNPTCLMQEVEIQFKLSPLQSESLSQASFNGAF